MIELDMTTILKLLGLVAGVVWFAVKLGVKSALAELHAKDALAMQKADGAWDHADMAHVRMNDHLRGHQ